MGDWPVSYLKNAVEELKSRLPKTNPDSSRLEDLNQGPPDFKSSALNHSATPPPLPSNYCEPITSCIECCTPYLTQSQFLLSIFFRHLISIMLKHRLASTAQLQRMKLYKILMSIGHLQSLTSETNVKKLWSKTLSRQCLIKIISKQESSFSTKYMSTKRLVYIFPSPLLSSVEREDQLWTRMQVWTDHKLKRT